MLSALYIYFSFSHELSYEDHNRKSQEDFSLPFCGFLVNTAESGIVISKLPAVLSADGNLHGRVQIAQQVILG